MKSITIHQPDHLPYPGFFSKVLSAESYLILDHVQYKKGNFQNRNKIVDNDMNEKWITLPIEKMPLNTPINKIYLSSHPKMIDKYINTLKASYSPFNDSERIISTIEDVVRNENNLSKINITLIKFILIDLFNYKGDILLSSNFKIDTRKSNLILDLCRELNSDLYLSGPSGRDYLDKDSFLNSNIKINYIDYKPYIFTNEISPFLSIIDPLIRHGSKKVKNVILENTIISNK